MVDPPTKFRDPESSGSALRVKKMFVTLKETWKEINLVKTYRPVLAHWPNLYMHECSRCYGGTTNLPP